MKVNCLDADGIKGDMHIGDHSARVGIILGTGLLGNRHGLQNAAENLARDLNAKVITLDPPSHHRNHREFTFGNYAEEQKQAAEFLREKEGIETVIGGGHSAGAMAGLFAAAGYNSGIDFRITHFTGHNDTEVTDFLPEYKKVFDGLILAGMPLDVRRALPWWMYTKPIIKLFNGMFHEHNDTGGENLTRYEPKPVGSIEWKHFFTKSLAAIRQYARTMPNPEEYVNMLWRTGDENAVEYIRQLAEMPKLVLVGGRDFSIFGSKVFLGFHGSIKRYKQYKETLRTFGQCDVDFYEQAANYLNSTTRFEADALWGLKAPEVQKDIARFVRTHFS